MSRSRITLQSAGWAPNRIFFKQDHAPPIASSASSSLLSSSTSSRAIRAGLSLPDSFFLPCREHNAHHQRVSENKWRSRQSYLEASGFSDIHSLRPSIGLPHPESTENGFDKPRTCIGE